MASNTLKIALQHALQIESAKQNRDDEIKRRRIRHHEEAIKQDKFRKFKDLQKDVKNLYQWTACPLKYSIFTGIAWATSEAEVEAMLIEKFKTYKDYGDYECTLRISVTKVNPDEQLIEISSYIE